MHEVHLDHRSDIDARMAVGWAAIRARLTQLSRPPTDALASVSPKLEKFERTTSGIRPRNPISTWSSISGPDGQYGVPALWQLHK